MSFIYEFTNWLDHVVEHPGRRNLTENGDGTVDFSRAEGEIVQQGTAQSASNFNNLEEGVLATQIQLIQIQQLQLQSSRSLDELSGSVGQTTLTNTQNYPFNNSAVTVAIEETRNNLEYDVEVEVYSAEGGFAESVDVYDKQLNGFKLKYTGSASKVVIKYKIVGGLY